MHRPFLSLMMPIATAILPAQTITVLQPGAADGKDAVLKGCVPCGFTNNNYGTNRDLPAVAWTNGGNLSIIRALFAFDLQVIPAGATVLDARLSLFHDPGSVEGTHSTSSGSNACLLQRVVQPWDEATVTWNTQPAATADNQVVIPATTSPTQDVIGIDVATLVQDMLNNPGQSHGFLLRLQNESSYRRMVFASSDNPDPALHPRLEITHQGGVGMGEQMRPTVRIHPDPGPGLFQLEGVAHVDRIDLYTVLGEHLAILAPQGRQQMPLDLAGHTPGIYLLRLHSPTGLQVERLVVR